MHSQRQVIMRPQIACSNSSFNRSVNNLNGNSNRKHTHLYIYQRTNKYNRIAYSMFIAANQLTNVNYNNKKCEYKIRLIFVFRIDFSGFLPKNLG